VRKANPAIDLAQPPFADVLPTLVRWSDVRMDEGTAIGCAMLALVPRALDVAG